ncbi:putative calcium-transporting ATPase 13, plasma membrane-type [Vitis vinifera]|uniref:Putative calcium-transporting ATPase 13, plasma membrane-type n=1 Tax=Vitis vinifera TaxID=29760 RepID=A0A438KKM0_VITVI|nr:putative calcium-transporting ATPase 13, plasma membrane-type [Vitis vinifera]
MSNILHFNLSCIESILDVPATLSKPNKKWHSAFATIYCSRALHSLLNKKTSSKLPLSTPSFVVVSVEPHVAFSNIDHTSLTAVVKEKNLDQLRELGGVEGRKTFGSNTYPRPPTKSFFYFVLEAFKDLTILILLACATLSLGFGIKEHGLKEGWYDGGSIFVAVFLVISVSAVSNFRQNRQFEKLSKVSNNIEVEVVRDGHRQKISIFEIVVGDVVCLKIGDQVPADGLFLDGHSLQVDESSMTGESDHVQVNSTQNPFLFSGTKVADGYAQMLARLVGHCFSSSCRVGGFATSPGIQKDENGNQEFYGSKTKADDIVNAMVRIIAAAVTIVVVAIPEGLPLAVTLTLAYSMKKMMADQAMVRKLPACETMGSATTICTDKTGVALNTTGSIYRATSGSEFEFSGSPTEKAILSWAVLELDMDMERLKQNHTILHVEAFNSEKKRSGILMRKKADNKMHVHWKGAAEMILAMCSSYYDASGSMKDLDDAEG